MTLVRFLVKGIVATFVYIMPNLLIADSCSNFEKAKELASFYRELPFIKDVACTVYSEGDFREIFRERINSQIQKTRILNEGIVYKLLGFIPLDYEYYNCILENYISESGAFYRVEKHDFVIIEGSGHEISTAVHELTHALQDQHFNIKNLTDLKLETSDALMAKFALIEGDAVEVEYSLPKDVINLSNNSKNHINTPAAKKIKNSCRILAQLDEMTSFVYEKGSIFIGAIKEKMGRSGVNYAFKMPPNSTSEILHPEKYIQRLNQYKKDDKSNNLIEINSKKEAIFSDQMGEYFINVLVSHYFPKERQSSLYISWQSDYLALYDLPNNLYQLEWNIRWQNTESSKRFALLLRDIFIKRSAGAHIKEIDNKYIISDKILGEAIILTKENQISLVVKSRKDIL